MKALFILAFTLTWAAQPAHAQRGRGSEVYIEQFPEREIRSVLAPALLKGSPRQDARIPGRTEHGLRANTGERENGNFARIDQRGANNVAVLHQRGTDNAALMTQTGFGNTTRLWQRGTHNVYVSRLGGTGNTLDLVQRGVGNVYLFDYNGNSLRHAVMQEGVGLKTIQLGKRTRPVSVTQRGRGMKVIIRHH